MPPIPHFNWSSARWCCDTVRLGNFCGGCGTPLSACPSIDEPTVQARRWIPYFVGSPGDESPSAASTQTEISEAFERASNAGHVLPEATLHEPLVDGLEISRLRLSERPAWRSLAEIATEGDAVVLARLSDGLYSLRDFAASVRSLDARGVGVKVLDIVLDTKSPFGQLFTKVLGEVADVEGQYRSYIGRITAKWLREHDRPSNHPPIGWRIVEDSGQNRFRTDDQDRLAAELFAGLRDLAGLSWRQIQRLTMRRGKRLRKPRGHKKWRGRPASGDWGVSLIQRYARAASAGFPCPGKNASPIDPDRARDRREHLLDQYLPNWRAIRDGREKLKL